MTGIVPRMLLVYGPRSPTYDFGPRHPLTPRRFGPGIDLLRSVGAEPGLAPEPATDDELLRCHERRYVDVVKRFSMAPFGEDPRAGIGEGGDDPPFAGMHEAAAMVAGGSLRAVEAVLARRRGARLPSGRRPPPRDAGTGVRLLHLQRPGAGDRSCPAGRAARAVRRPGRASRRRRPGDPLGRPGRADAVVPRDRAVPLPGDRRGGGAGRGCRGRDLGQRADGARHGGGRLAGGRPDAAPRAGRRVRAGPDRVAARRRFARLGPAGAPAGHHDRDGRGGPPRGCRRASIRRRALAGDRRRRLRRVPGRASNVEPGLAGRLAPRGPGIHGDGLA